MSNSNDEFEKKEYDYLIKALLIGDSGVGKTSLLLRFSDNSFSNMYFSIIGVDFKIRILKIDNKIVKLQIWDTVGQESFKTIIASFYRRAQCVLLVFDITDEESFINIKSWISDIDKYCGKKVPIVLIGNKCDLKNKRQVKTEDAEEFAKFNNMKYIETSAKHDKNIDNAFISITSTVIKKIDAEDAQINLQNDLQIKQKKHFNLNDTIKNNSCCAFL